MPSKCPYARTRQTPDTSREKAELRDVATSQRAPAAQGREQEEAPHHRHCSFSSGLPIPRLLTSRAMKAHTCSFKSLSLW